MNIKKDIVISLVYELREGNAEGKVVETIEKNAPLTFLFGHGNLLPKFEDNLDGLTTGDNFEFGLKSDEAYGEIKEEAIVPVPKTVFEVEGKIDENLVQLGNMIPMRDNQGNRLNGLVKEIQDENIIMDFNHPMAGKDLYFKGEVTELREATEEELAHGHIHAGGGCGSGGCGCGDEQDPNSCGSGGCSGC